MDADNAEFGSQSEPQDEPAVRAVGKVSEALEMTERARGHLYSFHQLTGRADLLLDDAAQQLRDAGHSQLAEHIAEHLIGRNVLSGRWSFQVIEEYDDGYYACFQDVEKMVRQQLTGGRRHAFEAAMKERRRTHGHRDHAAVPPESASQPTKE